MDEEQQARADHQAAVDALDAEWKQVKKDPEFIALMERRLKEKTAV